MNAEVKFSRLMGMIMPAMIFFVCAISPSKIGAQKPIVGIGARQFVETLGVNVHMEYTDGKYADVQEVQADLAYLGVSFVRDGAPNPATWMPPGQAMRAIRSLAAQGIKFDFIVSPPDSVSIQQMTQLELLFPGSVASVEGPNEINNWPISYEGLGGEAAARIFQSDLYRDIHKELRLRGVPIYYFTGGSPITVKSMASAADFANIHVYPKNGDEPNPWITSAVQQEVGGVGNLPTAMTEGGYYTLPGSKDWGGVDELTQAKGILNSYFDAARLGVSRTYLYELLDAYSDPSGTEPGKHFGFFNLQNSAKLSALALHNVTKFLKDATYSHGQLAFELTGLVSTAHNLLISKSDGSFVIAVWNETPFWEENSSEPLTSLPISAELCLPHAALSISSYDPLTAALTTLARGASCTSITIPDHPILISIR